MVSLVKTCSSCGTKKETLTQSERVFECSHCGFVIDRDLNAAINLSSEAVPFRN
ncbi:zinc ribbon domain-containing protein [Scytonema sp. PRP1]